MKVHYMLSKLLLIYVTVIWQGIYCVRDNVNSKHVFDPNAFRVFIESRLSEDGRLSFEGLAAKYGHPAEKRSVITTDGYNLTLYHIKGDAYRTVLLVHGNTAASDCWITRGETSLAITLARQGYDVWAINMRGTTESRNHIFIDPDADPESFFNYSFYEQGYYDIPATIDYILNDTKQTQLLAIGHSIGTTVFYVMGAERPEYNQKIKAFISLAPICFLQHLRGTSMVVSEIWPYTPFRNSELSGVNQLTSLIPKAVCVEPLGYETCVRRMLSQTFGPNEEGLEREFFPTLYGHYPVGTSVKMFMHLTQVANLDKFIRFDYGRKINEKMYGSTESPEIDLSRVTMKVALLVGRNDYLSSVGDAERLRNMLPNVVYYQVMSNENFNHLDFVWGRYMTSNLYPYLLPLIKVYSETREYSYVDEEEEASR